MYTERATAAFVVFSQPRGFRPHRVHIHREAVVVMYVSTYVAQVFAYFRKKHSRPLRTTLVRDSFVTDNTNTHR